MAPGHTAARTVTGAELTLGLPVSDATALGLQFRRFDVMRLEDFEAAFTAIVKWRAHAIGLGGTPLTARYRHRIIEFAKQNRLPSRFGFKPFVEAGGLMSYAPDEPATIRQSVTYVDKILRGAKPADLPVEQPTKFEFVINLKTLRHWGSLSHIRSCCGRIK